ncbi:hypothetical protein V8F33_005446 [Rhypophila sp. PSN 637]
MLTYYSKTEFALWLIKICWFSVVGVFYFLFSFKFFTLVTWSRNGNQVFLGLLLWCFLFQDFLFPTHTLHFQVTYLLGMVVERRTGQIDSVSRSSFQALTSQVFHILNPGFILVLASFTLLVHIPALFSFVYFDHGTVSRTIHFTQSASLDPPLPILGRVDENGSYSQPASKHSLVCDWRFAS